MKCEKCKSEMKLTTAWDDAQETDHAFNIYFCLACGTLFRESIWQHPSKIWIFPDGEIKNKE